MASTPDEVNNDDGGAAAATSGQSNSSVAATGTTISTAQRVSECFDNIISDETTKKKISSMDPNNSQQQQQQQQQVAGSEETTSNKKDYIEDFINEEGNDEPQAGTAARAAGVIHTNQPRPTQQITTGAILAAEDDLLRAKRGLLYESVNQMKKLVDETTDGEDNNEAEYPGAAAAFTVVGSVLANNNNNRTTNTTTTVQQGGGVGVGDDDVEATTTIDHYHHPGAFPIGGMTSNAATALAGTSEDEEVDSSTNSVDDRDNANPQPPQPPQSTGDEEEPQPLFINHARLVGEVDDGDDTERAGERQATVPMVEAKPALEGYQAFIHNKKFRFAVCILAVIVLAIVIPIAALFREQGKKIVQTVNQTVVFDCGTQERKQADYRGFLNSTESGTPCQPWSSQEPHSHTYLPELFPHSELEGNYCRNPNGNYDRAWCYPNRSDVATFEYCDVPYCGGEPTLYQLDCGSSLDRQRDYRGTQNFTNSGRICQKWSKTYPHDHDNTPEQKPNAGLEDNNFCRNPDDENAAWCYTTDPEVRWEFCGIPNCYVRHDDVHGSLELEECPGCGPQQCGTLDTLQNDYRGNISITESGRECQRWDSQIPHGHNLVESYPDAGLVENYCRNPDGENRAWCYTVDPDKRWEFCTVPQCSRPMDNDTCGTARFKQQDYRGRINVTVSGRTCQRWDSYNPHSHNFEPRWNLAHGIAANYCRNPDGRERSWCLTTDPDVRIEFCDVPECFDPYYATDFTSCGTVDKKKSDYRGYLNTTTSGLICQHWASQVPNKHKITPESHPFAGLEGNFCRNPDSDNGGPWCFTTSEETLWERCDVPSC